MICFIEFTPSEMAAISLAGSVLSLFSILLAILFFFKSSSHVKKISKSISTKFIGEFPQHIHLIIEEVISKAKKEVCIASDVAPYACFSNPVDYRNYQNKILSKLIDQDFQLTLYIQNRNMLKESFLKQFDEDSENLDDFFKNDERKQKEFQKKLDFFCEYNHHDRNDIKTVVHLVTAITKIQNSFLSELSLRNTKLYEFRDKVLLNAFMWKNDIGDAIFSLYTNDKEAAFFTNDRNVIKILEEGTKALGPMPIKLD